MTAVTITLLGLSLSPLNAPSSWPVCWEPALTHSLGHAWQVPAGCQVQAERAREAVLSVGGRPRVPQLTAAWRGGANPSLLLPQGL